MPVGVYERKKGYKRPKEVGEKISRALAGRKPSPEQIAKMAETKRKNPTRYWLGKTRPPHSEETKAKMSASHKLIGTKPPVRRGKANNKWKGGVSRAYRTGYYSTEYKKWRMSVFERDGFTCQCCEQTGGYLTAHHIKSQSKYPELQLNLENGVTLCEECHKLTDNYKGKNKGKQRKELE